MKPYPLYSLEIAPLVILPLGRSPLFSYANREAIPKGSLVSIPFGRREIQGVVYDCRPLPGRQPSWMKSVSEVLQPAFLTPEQCGLALAISEEYFTPLGKTLRHFLPKQVKARKKKTTPPKQAISPLKPAKDDRELLKTFEKTALGTPLCLDTSALSDPKRFFSLLAKKSAARKKQTLILVPEITLIPALQAAFSEFFPEERISVLHSQLADGPYFEHWERIRSGEAQTVIATRQGLFAPFNDLGTIVLTEEQDESYKQWDMSPRYHGKRVAEMLASIHTAHLLLASGTPSAESVRRIEEKKYLSLLPLATVPPLGNPLAIVNLKLERFKKNYSPLSEILRESLRETLAEKRQALLYINRQGMSAFSVCENCKNVFRCKDCGHALTATKDGYFRCLSCGHKTGLFPGCPSCGHLSFRSVGFGTEKIEKEVLRAFPGARVLRIDGSAIRQPKAAQSLYEKGISGKIDILVGTQMILKDPPLPKLALIAMIDADSLLLFPDFRADERLLQHLVRAARQVGKNGRVIVQTFHPESAFFQRIAGLDSAALYAKMLAERKDLFYPPFSRLIAVTCQGATPEAAEKKASEISEALRETVSKDGSIRVGSPQTSRHLKRRRLHESSFLVRFPENRNIPDALAAFLKKISKECIIDVDPLSFS